MSPVCAHCTASHHDKYPPRRARVPLILQTPSFLPKYLPSAPNLALKQCFCFDWMSGVTLSFPKGKEGKKRRLLQTKTGGGGATSTVKGVCCQTSTHECQRMYKLVRKHFKPSQASSECRRLLLHWFYSFVCPPTHLLLFFLIIYFDLSCQLFLLLQPCHFLSATLDVSQKSGHLGRVNRKKPA